MRHFEDYDGFSSLWHQHEPGFIIEWIVETPGVPFSWWSEREAAVYAMIQRKVLYDASL